MKINIFLLILLSIFLHGCMGSGNIQTKESLTPEEGKSTVLSSVFTLSKSPLIMEITGWCKSVKTGEEIKCLGSKFNYRLPKYGKKEANIYTIRADKDRLNFSSVRHIPLGKYTLHKFNYHVDIGTSISKYSKKPILEKHVTNLESENISFEIKDRYSYLGNFSFDFGIDNTYKPVLKSIKISNKINGDIDKAPIDIQKQLRVNLKKASSSISTRVIHIPNITLVGKWGKLKGIPIKKDVNSCVNSVAKLTIGADVSIVKNVLIYRRNKVHQKTSRQEITCALKTYMNKNSYSEFRQLAKIQNKSTGKSNISITKIPFSFR